MNMQDRIRGAFGPAELILIAGIAALGLGVAGRFDPFTALIAVSVVLIAVAWTIR